MSADEWFQKNATAVRKSKTVGFEDAKDRKNRLVTPEFICLFLFSPPVCLRREFFGGIYEWKREGVLETRKRVRYAYVSKGSKTWKKTKKNKKK